MVIGCERDTREKRAEDTSAIFFLPFSFFSFLIRDAFGESSRHGRGGSLFYVLPRLKLHGPVSKFGECILSTSQAGLRRRATSAGGQTNLSRHIRRRTDQPFTTGHASSTTKRGALKWLTQEADAMNWSSPKHVQPEEGRKEPAPRAIRFRKSRVETTIRERAGSSQEGRKRAKDTPG